MSEPIRTDSEHLLRLGDRLQELQGCEPDFLVISPPKTGTTWLSQNLSSHPEIYIPPIKEINYFSVYCREFDINWYLRHFQSAGLRRKGEATPYAALPLSVIQSISKQFPHLKLVFLMRDPIKRAWSQTKHDYRFRQGVFSSYTGRFEEIPDQKFIESFTTLDSINVGDYLLCLKRWLSCFEREQIYVGFFESIESGPEVLFRQILSHLEVKSDVDLSGFPISERIFPGIEKEVPAGLQPYLQAIYAHKTRELVEFLKKQFQISPPSEWDATVASDEPDPLQLEEDYSGYQLLLYRSKCYALPEEQADLAFRKDGQLLRGELERGDYLNPTRNSRSALSTLCHSDWHPVYAFIRRNGYDRGQAQDLTPGVFALFLEKNFLMAADRNRGPFHPFLLAAVTHFLANEWDRAHALKREGGLPTVSINLVIAETRYAPAAIEEATPASVTRNLTEKWKSLQDLCVWPFTTCGRSIGACCARRLPRRCPSGRD